MSRFCFASFPVCAYKFSSHCLNNIIFIDNSLGPLARDSSCIYILEFNELAINGPKSGNNNFKINVSRFDMGTAVAQCLKCCATNRKVAG